MTMGRRPMWSEIFAYGLSSRRIFFSPEASALMLILEVTPDGMSYVPIREKLSQPCLKLNLSEDENAPLVIERYHTASSRLVFPSPLPPLMQLMLGEKPSSWSPMLRKFWMTIFFSVGIPYKGNEFILYC